MDQLLYYILYPILWLLSKLPFWVLYNISNFCFYLLYYIFGYRKKVVHANLKMAFPERSEQELNRLSKLFFRHMCDLIVESLKSLTISEHELRRRFVYENLEYCEELRQKDLSTFIMCGHYASWEWSFMMPMLVPFHGIGVYKKLKNPYFDRLVRRIRGRFEGVLVPNKEIRQYLSQCNENEVKTMTMIISDQSPKSKSFRHSFEFLGHQTPFFTGTEDMARKMNFALIFLKIEKVKRGYYKGTVVPISEEANAEQPGDITRKFIAALEEQIQKEPQYYLWSHKRWKHHPEFQKLMS
jgi:KDO2-lipid IV(A) lauroyltransferase